MQWLEPQSAPSAVCFSHFSQLSSSWIGQSLTEESSLLPPFHSSQNSIHWDGKGTGLILSIPDINPIIQGVLLLPLHSSHNSIPFMARGGERHQMGLLVENGLHHGAWLRCKIGLIALREVFTRASACVLLSFIPHLFSQIQERQWEAMRA